MQKRWRFPQKHNEQPATRYTSLYLYIKATKVYAYPYSASRPIIATKRTYAKNIAENETDRKSSHVFSACSQVICKHFRRFLHIPITLQVKRLN